MRYLGWKPFNWPAAFLVFGWIGLAFAWFLLGGDRAVSVFGRSLSVQPVVWWPEVSIVGFLLFFSPLALGGLAIYLIPKVDWSTRVGALFVALGTGAAVLGMAWDANSGVAVYRDRVVHRAGGINQPLHTDKFSDVRRVETACVVTRTGRRGPRRAEPSFILIFSNGRRVDIWSRGLGDHGGSLAGRLSIIRMADQTASHVGATRAPSRKPDGSLIGSRGCVARLAEELGVLESRIAPLFVVDQSELRHGEYIIAKEA